MKRQFWLIDQYQRVFSQFKKQFKEQNQLMLLARRKLVERNKPASGRDRKAILFANYNVFSRESLRNQFDEQLDPKLKLQKKIKLLNCVVRIHA